MSKEARRRYAVARRRGASGTGGQAWQQRLAQTPGVVVIGATAHRAQVEATEEGIAEAAAQLGEDFLIEPLIPRDPRGGSGTG
jgi:hypothetical protein